MVADDLATVRTEFGRFARQVSGYSLEHLLPEHGASLDRFLVGSEGTLGVVTGATVRLVADPPYRALVVLGYPSMPEAADVVPELLTHDPVACEGMDRGSARWSRRCRRCRGATRWLLVELTGDLPAELSARCERLAAAAGPVDQLVVTDLAQQRAIWAVREDGAGLAARATDPPGQPGWEDAAVPPERLGSYLRGFEELLSEHGLDGAPYGHLGDGCLHIRVNFDLAVAAGAAALPRSSWSRPPTSRSPTTAACRGSTATAGPAPSCSVGCTRHVRWS